MTQLRWTKGVEIVVDNQRNGQDKDAHKATHCQLAGMNVLCDKIGTMAVVNGSIEAERAGAEDTAARLIMTHRESR